MVLFVPSEAAIMRRRPPKCANAVRMNTRRNLLFMLGAGTLLSPGTSLAQQQESKKIHQIGLLTRKKDASVLTQIEAFRQKLRDLGWIEGRNVNIVYRDADGQLNRLDSLALELVNLNVDVIVTVDTPPTQAAKRATSTIPIVVAVSADPVGAGLVESLARPGGNTTGLSLLAPGTDQKTLELLKETIPEAKRVSMIVDPQNRGMMRRVEAIKTAAIELKIVFEEIPVHDKEALLSELVTITNAPPDALMLLSPIYAAYGKEILDFATNNKVPIFCDTIGLARQSGVLLSYGADISKLFRGAAIFVDKILKGSAPADLPVEQPTSFELAVNLKTAKTLGLTVPFSVVMRADEVIE
jgi:putative ABC transport system substrate-binding protein